MLTVLIPSNNDTRLLPNIYLQSKVEVNCQDFNIQNVVNQQMSQFENNDPLFFRTKAQEVCPYFSMFSPLLIEFSYIS